MRKCLMFKQMSYVLPTLSGLSYILILSGKKSLSLKVKLELEKQKYKKMVIQ